MLSGLFSLKKKIKDVVLKAEMLAPDALELEEEQWIKQEETLRYCDLWDDPTKSDEIFLKLAARAKAVDTLKDLKYKVLFCLVKYIFFCKTFSFECVFV